MVTLFTKAAATYSSMCGKAYAAALVGSAKFATTLMLIVGVSILTAGLDSVSDAQVRGNVGVGVNVGFGGGGGSAGAGTFGDPGVGVQLGDFRIHNVTQRLFELIEGNFGALIMVAAGLGAIISAAFGAYRMAVGLLVVAVGALYLALARRYLLQLRISSTTKSKQESQGF